VYRGLIAGREIRETLAAIRATGATAEYLAVDVTDAAATAAALAPHRDRITGLVHGAGVLADKAIVDQRSADVGPVLATKLAGLRSVLDALGEDRLNHVVLFSSIAGFFGNRGQSSYASANEALNRVAAALRRRLPAARVTSVNWGAWAGGMVTPELERMFAERGVTLIPLPTGVDFFAEQFSTARSHDVVVVVGPNQPLSAKPPREIASGTTVLRLPMTGLADDEVLSDHAIGGIPVLPATAAVGAILGAAQRLRGIPATRLTGFSVLKGVVLDEDAPQHLDLAVTGEQVLVTDSTGRPRFRAQVPAESAGAAPVLALPDLSVVEPVTAYTDGVLFHGPSLAAITGTVAAADGRLVAVCRPVESRLGAGEFAAGQYSPEPADLLLQAALVQVHRTVGLNSLPTAIGAVEVYDALPGTGEFLVVVDALQINGSVARGTVTACARDGRVLLRFEAVQLVADAALGAKFHS
ncbi:SDR family NAD(P)-dependent oxidoreductase, partial [Nocardia sp. NPDC059154]